MAEGSYLGSLDIISRDFERITEYIEPTEDNIHIYSHRLFELLLRACTEFESVCKDVLVSRGSTTDPSDMSINDYKTLEAEFNIDPVLVGIRIWRPSTKYVQPFKAWATSQPPLSWYSSYNKVKHNRNTEFKKANLENVCSAVSGLFALLAHIDVITMNQHGMVSKPCMNTYREHYYPGHIFTYVVPLSHDRTKIPRV
jgi:hypothetical protein